jgi:hypothetical protein
VAGDLCGFDDLASQRIRHEQAAAAGKADAVAAMADMVDAQAFSHGGRR